MREFSQYKFVYNCVEYYLGSLNDDVYDYIYDLNEDTQRPDAIGYYVEGTERQYSVESMYVDNPDDNDSEEAEEVN